MSQKERNARYRATHREDHAERARKWAANNPEKIRAAGQKRYAEHREQIQARNRKYYADHQQECREQMQRWRAANPEMAREAGRKWKTENPQRASANQQKYYTEHLEESKAQTRRWRLAHPGAKAAHNRNRKARIRSASGRHTAADILRLFDFQYGRCAACSVSLVASGKGKYHVDHVIPVSRGGSNDPGNLQLLCPFCNTSKKDKTPDEWAQTRGKAA